MTLSTLADTETFVRVALAGSLDIAGSQQIENRFLAAISGGKKSLIVDLSGVDYIASFGMRLFIQAYKLLDREGKKLVLLSPQPNALKVLEAAGLTDLLVITDDETKALAAVA